MPIYVCWYRHMLFQVEIMNDVHLAVTRGEAAGPISSNIDHSTPIKCLSSWFGVGGVVLDWFRSYLCDHYWCIKIGSD